MRGVVASWTKSESARELRSSLYDIEKRIERVVEELNCLDPVAKLQPSGSASRARDVQKLRARRNAIFGHTLFGEPAWDMLLDLYASECNGRGECVSNLCLASNVPQTTALRWIRTMEQQGWIIRHPDVTDRRRTFVRLTTRARTAMDSFFSQPELQTFASSDTSLAS